MRRAGASLAALILALAALSGCNSLARLLFTPDIDPAAADLTPGDFALDPLHAALIFRINHLGFADYIGRFEGFDAQLSGDPGNPEAAVITARIDMTSLNVANPDFAAELMGPGWFDASRFPAATFRSQSIRRTGEETAEIDGELTLRGMTQPVMLSARLNGSAYDPLRRADVVGFSASTEISRSAFGISRFSGLLTDTVRIEIEAEFIRAPAG